MILRVKSTSHLQLPHTISKAGKNYVLAPDAEMLPELAEPLIRTYPNLYEEGKGAPDLKAYTFSDVFKNKSVADIIKTLPNDKKLQAFDYVKALAAGKEPEPESSDPDITEEETDLLDIFRKLAPADRAGVVKYVSKK